MRRKYVDRILITGGAGFIGRNLVSKMANAGDYEIVVFDNESSGDRRAVDLEGVTFIHGDIRNRDELRSSLYGISAIINLAADTRVMDSIKDPELNFDVNVAGTFNLLVEARGAGIKTVINASTGGAIIGDAPPPVHEEMPAMPLSPYGASKLANEGYMSAFAGAYGMRMVSLRFSNVYGSGSFHKGSVVAHFFKRILNGEFLEVFGDGSQQRDFLYIDDLTNGAIAALNSEANGIFQLGSGQPTSINDLIDEIRTVVGPDFSFEVKYNDARAGEVHRSWCKIDKANRELGFTPCTPLRNGLAKTWSWFLNEKKSTT